MSRGNIGALIIIVSCLVIGGVNCFDLAKLTSLVSVICLGKKYLSAAGGCYSPENVTTENSVK